MANVSIDGFSELIDSLRFLGDKAIQAENKILKKSAKVVQEKASQKAPRSQLTDKHKESWRTGKHMADNIIISKIDSMNGRKFIRVGVAKGDNSEYFYSKFIEWGTSKLPARPFLQPSLEESGIEILEIAKVEMREALGL